MAVVTRLANAGDLASLRRKILAGRKSTKIAISVCAGTGCRAQGSMELFEEFLSVLDALSFQGFSHQGGRRR